MHETKRKTTRTGALRVYACIHDVFSVTCGEAGEESGEDSFIHCLYDFEKAHTHFQCVMTLDKVERMERVFSKLRIKKRFFLKGEMVTNL